MAEITLSSANQYAKMSRSFYDEYLAIDEEHRKALSSYTEGLVHDNEAFSLLAAKEEKAIAAIVFQAFAIEAYVNLLGITVFGEQDFYEKIDKNEKGARRSTHEKAEMAFKALHKEYPKEHNEKIKALFKKRNSLVHQKPHKLRASMQPFDYNHPEESYKDYLDFLKPFEYLFSNLEEQINLYSEFQENIRIIRGAEKELIEEITEQELSKNLTELL